MKMRIINQGFYYELQFKESLFSCWATLYDGSFPCRMDKQELKKAIGHYKKEGYRLV